SATFLICGSSLPFRSSSSWPAFSRLSEALKVAKRTGFSAQPVTRQTRRERNAIRFRMAGHCHPGSARRNWRRYRTSQAGRAIPRLPGGRVDPVVLLLGAVEAKADRFVEFSGRRVVAEDPEDDLFESHHQPRRRLQPQSRTDPTPPMIGVNVEHHHLAGFRGI